MGRDYECGRFDELPSDEVYAGVIRRSFSSEQATVTSYTFEAGATFPLHSHPQEQITLIEAGEVEMTVGDQVEALTAGEWNVVAPDVAHGLRAGHSGARVLAVVVPRRESADAYRVLS